MKTLLRWTLPMAIALVGVLGSTPSSASAGAWAITYLDPVPERIKPSTTYTVGYWVLQHGTHPYVPGSMGPRELGKTGLQLTDARGKTHRFDGTPLAEKAHYATAISVPEGTWTVEAIQGVFKPWEVGTLTVPGGLKLNPPSFDRGGPVVVEDHWGAIRPPSRTVVDAPAKPPAVVPPAVRPAASISDNQGAWRQPYTIGAIAVVVALLLGAGIARRRVGRRTASSPEPDGS